MGMYQMYQVRTRSKIFHMEKFKVDLQALSKLTDEGHLSLPGASLSSLSESVYIPITLPISKRMQEMIVVQCISSF